MSDSGPPPKEDQPKTPWPKPNGIYHSYNLNCHCGAIKLRIRISPPLFPEHAQGRTLPDIVGDDNNNDDDDTPELFTPIACNCSSCQRHGALAVHLPVQDVTWVKGGDDRREYWCGPKRCPHWFCGTCAGYIGADLRPVMRATGQEDKYMINVRNLSDYDVDLLRTVKGTFMRDMEPKYRVPD